jgi:tetratricopeptide (TPR) repeat protein
MSGEIMKRYFPLVVLAAIAVVFATTGFQCGSAEMTTAKLAMNQGQWDKAEQSLLKELQKNDKNEEAWFELGRVRWNMKKYIEANEAFNRALGLSQVHAVEIGNFRLNLWQQNINDGVLAYNSGLHFINVPDSVSFADPQFAQAARQFEVATQVIPDSALAHYLVGMSKGALRDYDGAEKAYRNALLKRKDYQDAYRMLGALHLNKAEDFRLAKNDQGYKEELRKSAAIYEEARAAYPGESDFVSKLIGAYQALGDDERAMAIVKEALARDPNKREYVYVYGEFLLKRGDFEQSIEQLKKSIQLKDTSDVVTNSATANLGIAYLNWGVALREEANKKSEAAAKAGKKITEDNSYLEKYKSAIPYLEKAVEIDPKDAQSWDRLAKLYTAFNMKDKAKMAYDTVDRLMKGR